MRVLPRARWARLIVIVALLAAYSVVMWYEVFPWVDRTYVNRPALDQQQEVVAPSATPVPTTT